MTAVANDLLQDFLAEASELLDNVDRKLVELEQRPDDKALLNEIFRGFHTVKGGAGFLEAAALVDVCHRTESLFDQLRSGQRTLSAEMLDTILAATAAVRTMFEEMAGSGTPSPAAPSLLDALTAWNAGDPPRAPAAPAATPATADRPSTRGVEASPASVAGGAGEPDWAMLLGALLGRPLDAAVAAPAAAPAIAPAEPPRAPAPPAPAAAAPAPAKPMAETTLRIDVGRFDQILNLSGEIGLTKNRLLRLRTHLLAGGRDPERMKEFDQVVNELASLVGDLQNSVMKARMQPVGRVFQKYLRLARDLGRQLGKDVELTIVGEETEIDKNMLEALNDPIVHLVRNAVDHGVDTPAERAAAGKPPRATVRLEARQIGDAIRIEVADDGRGMDAAVLRRKVVEKGLMPADQAAALDDQEALNLVFLPGFSTAQAVSNVSGRGVGMDVVRNNVAKLSGRITLRSQRGSGTCVTIDLPLTLAILPVLMFRLQRQPYAIPLSVVREIVELDPDRLASVSGRPGVSMRGEVMPVVDVADLLGRPRDHGRIGIVIHFGGQSMVLAVDSFVGQDEVVIKALEGFKPTGVAGATLANDGSLVLVLDLAELLATRGLKLAA